jgi:hypothetical protein
VAIKEKKDVIYLSERVQSRDTEWDGEKIHKLNKFKRHKSIKIKVTGNNISHLLPH